jgi:hypothetical protein
LTGPRRIPVPAIATLRDPAASLETVWIYFDTLCEVGHPDHVRVFATRETSEKWLADVDPRGTIFEYDVLGRPISSQPAETAETAETADNKETHWGKPKLKRDQ